MFYNVEMLRWIARACLLICVNLVAGEPQWTRLVSPNFEMYTTAGPRGARDTLRYFEQVHSFFEQQMPNAAATHERVRIVAFSSTGQARWEDRPNSGMGSNALTSARHDMLKGRYRHNTETYAPELPSGTAYCGPYRLLDLLPHDERFTIAEALQSPTRTYLPLIIKLRRALRRSQMIGLVHCSGGGQTKIRKFGPPDIRFVKDKPLPVPPLFLALQEAGKTSWHEMYATCNMGWRLEAIVTADAVNTCIDVAKAEGIEAQEVGYVDKAVPPLPRLSIFTPYGTLEYK